MTDLVLLRHGEPCSIPRSRRVPAGRLPTEETARHLALLAADTNYDRLKGSWEERFERRYGFWRGSYDAAVMR